MFVVVASALGGLADDGTVLIVTRFIKGVSAAFTAPAALSIITTTFAEGPARNRALAIFTATGATGFSLGLVIGGLLTEIGWRWVFFLPAPVALAVLLAGLRLVPKDHPAERGRGSFDIFGAVSLTGAMLLLVFTLVEAPSVGFLSPRTIGSLAGVAAILVSFVAQERRTASPLVRLGILRNTSLVRANLGAMSLFGSWVGFQFVVTLYLQQLRGWSALETGLAIFPAGLIVALVSPRIGTLIGRFGVTRAARRRRARLAGRGLCAVPADQPRVGLRVRHAADLRARRDRVRPGVRAAQRRGDERRRSGRAGARRRPPQHVVRSSSGARSCSRS